MNALAALAARHPRRLALTALLVFVIVGVFGGPAVGVFKANDPFADKGSASYRAEQQADAALGVETTPGVLVIVPQAPSGAEATAAGAALRSVDGVARVSPPLGSADGRSTVLAVSLDTAFDSDQVVSRVESALHPIKGVEVGGGDVAGVQVGKQAGIDLGIAEGIAFPVLAILALLIFRGVGALLPLAAGGLSVLTAFTVVRLINLVVPISVFALNLIIGLGLGLAVDYSLFLVWRFRAELANGRDVPEALRVTLASTGRTILFSAVTVAAAMSALMVFPQRFLVSMGIGGAVVALVAAASALLVVPALMVLLGRRLAKASTAPDHEGFWWRLSQGVMRRSWVVALGTGALLVVFALPALGVKWSGIDATILPTSKSARVVQDTITRDFPSLHGGESMLVVADGTADLSGYEAAVRAVPGVTGVSVPQQARGRSVLTVSTNAAAISAQGQRIVHDVRAVPAPTPVLVGGPAADFADLQSSIRDHLPLALIVLGLATLILLWLMTGSVVLPVKTLLMNLLTTAAATGLLVFVFQDGRFSSVLAYRSQGGIEETDFVVFVALAFALSTDYGIFLLDRIREARQEGLEERTAIATGLERTGRLVTAAALMLAVAIGAFALSKLVFLKEVGIGTAAAVLLDAFVVRALLVPSLMAMLGAANWWSPRWLSKVHSRATHKLLPAARTEVGAAPVQHVP